MGELCVEEGLMCERWVQSGWGVEGVMSMGSLVGGWGDVMRLTCVSVKTRVLP